ncbi:MAG: 4-alpha-glucanotransferase [Verrucomicrobiota bacterium]
MSNQYPAGSVPVFSWLNRRTAGVLLHPTAFPGGQGVGVLDGSVRTFLDFLAAADVKTWQICPLGPTGYGDSPYQCFSAFAGNPYLIDLQALVGAGLLDATDLEPLQQLPRDHVDYGWLYVTKWPALFKAFEAFNDAGRPALFGDFEAFKAEKASWLDAFTLFQALKDHFGGRPWWEWPAEVRFHEQAVQSPITKQLADTAEAHAFFQYLFFGQWSAVRDHARELGIEIIGDAPIFVARDSADVWANPSLFQLDHETGRPLAVAGVPPDYFSATGQLWGNPLYDWAAHRADGYAWWIERLRANFALCDIVRIDHFRAFDTYWSIPADATDARGGEWLQGPGLDFFLKVKAALPDARMIAEDLGELFPSVVELRDATGLPGMTILQFAFGGDAGNLYLPHNLRANNAVYPGTHDNDTTLGWYASADEKTRDHVRRYLRVGGDEIGWDFVRAAYGSVSNLAVFPLQDLLSLGSEGRFNTPGEPAGNWQWRYQSGQLARLRTETAPYLRQLAELYSR